MSWAADPLPVWEGTDGLEGTDILQGGSRAELIAITTFFGSNAGNTQR
jgi:hypothetical protein